MAAEAECRQIREWTDMILKHCNEGFDLVNAERQGFDRCGDPDEETVDIPQRIHGMLSDEFKAEFDPAHVDPEQIRQIVKAKLIRIGMAIGVGRIGSKDLVWSNPSVIISRRAPGEYHAIAIFTIGHWK